MDIFELIQKRRSVKPEYMKTDPISHEILYELLEAANWAPSHGLTEPWRFVIFEGDARNKLGRAITTTMTEDGAPLPETDKRAVNIFEKVQTAPLVLAIVCHPSDKSNIVLHEEIASCAMAVQNIHLAATSLGLAGFWSSGEKAFHPRIKQFLELKDQEQCLGFFYLGYPKGEWPKSERGSIKDKIRFF